MKKVLLALGVLVCVLVFGSIMGKVVASDKSDSQKEDIPPDVANIQSALQVLAPYIYQNKNKKVLFDISGAEQAGVSEEYIELGEELVALTNSVVSRKRVKKERLERFASYFSYIANNGVPVSAKEKKIYKHCGDKENPTPCPPRVWSRSFPSRQAVVDYLFKEGYHIMTFQTFKKYLVIFFIAYLLIGLGYSLSTSAYLSSKYETFVLDPISILMWPSNTFFDVFVWIGK